jgi:hypothetical protein
VWLNLPRHVVVRQVTARTLRRLFSREELWNGNLEPLSNVSSWNPERLIVRWAWTQHRKYEERYGAAMISLACARLVYVRPRSHDEAEAWLAGAPACCPR